MPMISSFNKVARSLEVSDEFLLVHIEYSALGKFKSRTCCAEGKKHVSNDRLGTNAKKHR